MIRGKELAQVVLDHVAKHPEHHHQGNWVRDRVQIFNSNPEYNECGTQACLAGWTVLLSSSRTEGRTAEALRREVAGELGIHPWLADWETVALKLLFPDRSPGELPAEGTPEWEVQRSFYATGSEQYAIELFADALGLEIPEGADDE